MDRKEAREHLGFIKRAIDDLGYSCIKEFLEIKEKFTEGKFSTNQELYDETSRMMCRERHRIYG